MSPSMSTLPLVKLFRHGQVVLEANSSIFSAPNPSWPCTVKFQLKGNLDCCVFFTGTPLLTILAYTLVQDESWNSYTHFEQVWMTSFRQQLYYQHDLVLVMRGTPESPQKKKCRISRFYPSLKHLLRKIDSACSLSMIHSCATCGEASRTHLPPRFCWWERAGSKSERPDHICPWQWMNATTATATLSSSTRKQSIRHSQTNTLQVVMQGLFPPTVNIWGQIYKVVSDRL